MNWTETHNPVAPWDTRGLPDRTMDERCRRHKHCSYRDDDPARCPVCHSTCCGGKHGQAPSDGSWKTGAVASPKHTSLREAQPIHPGEAEPATGHGYSPQQGSPTALPEPALNTFTVGDRVTVKRDETRHPAKGTWKQFGGLTGTVEKVNADTQHPHLTEYGMTLKGHGLTWFKPWELVPA